MHYLALATDFDGTVAHHGTIDNSTRIAIEKLRASGCKVILVTGRELDDLLALLPQPELFDRIVAENGALIFDPASKSQKVIGPAPTDDFVRELKRRGVSPLSVGQVIVATWEPHQSVVLDVIRDLGLERQVIFNKGAVMILPTGINKVSGLALALAELGLSRHNVVGVGDAENDHAFLEWCGCSAAVANSIPSLLQNVRLQLRHHHGAGVVELIERILADDLMGLACHDIHLGTQENGEPIAVDPVEQAILVCGSSCSGKSTLTTGLLERLQQNGYQFIIFDPEGDYDRLDFSMTLGSPSRAPLAEELFDVLKDSSRNLTVNMLGVPLESRPSFFADLFPRILDMRQRMGRPHVIVIDEAHHLLPVEWQPAKNVFTERTRGLVYVTIHPESLAAMPLQTIDTVLAVGENPGNSIAGFCRAAKLSPPTDHFGPGKLTTGDAVLFRRGEKQTRLVHTEKPTTERKRHSRKYAEGNLGTKRSFYFRGSKGTLNLKAYNLLVFLQLADGVDDETWMHHLKRNEYSQWMRVSIKDTGLANAVTLIELDSSLSPIDSRAKIRDEVEARYTLPADLPIGLFSDDSQEPSKKS